MAHAHEQTLLARLGFADPDRQNPIHDDVCRYLVGNEGREAVARTLGPKDSDLSPASTGLRQIIKNQMIQLTGERERTITKGKGHTRFTIGFLDAIIHMRYQRDEVVIEQETSKIRSQVSKVISHPLVIEVKIHREPVGQILRQVNFYRDFINDYINADLNDLSGYTFVVATRYKPTFEELDTLENADIQHLLIGEGFNRYIEQQVDSIQPIYQEI